MRRSRRRLPLHQQMMTDLSLTPLVDTALTLLIIFMVATPMIRHAVRVQLPQGTSQEAPRTKEEYVVYIDAHNEFFFKSKKYALGDLIKAIQEEIGKKEEMALFIRADTHASWGTVNELFQNIRSLKGFKNVFLPLARA